MAAWNARWCLCRIIGDGLSPETAFRPKVADYGANFEAYFGTNPVNGQPFNPLRWCIVKATLADATAAAADPEIQPFPANVSPGSTWSSLTANQRQTFTAVVMNRFELDISGTPTGATIRQILKALLDRHDPVPTPVGAFS